MARIPGILGNGVFATVPMTVNVSQHLDHNCVAVWIYLRSLYAHEDGFTDPKKSARIAAALGMSESTYDRSKRRLDKFGFVEIRGAGNAGLRYRTCQRASVPDDFGAFGQDDRYAHTLTDGLYAKVTRDMVTHGPSARAIRVYVILDRIAGRDPGKPENYGWAYVSRKELAAWLGVGPDAISADIAQLGGFGLLDVEKFSAGRMNRYRVNSALKNPEAKYRETLKARKQQEAKEAKRQAAAAAREARKTADAVERLRASVENEPDLMELAQDLTVYWFRSLGDTDWPIRNPAHVYHMQTALRIVLLDISPESVEGIIDGYLRSHEGTAEPTHLIPLMRRHLTPAGDDHVKRLVLRSSQLFRATRDELGPEPEPPGGLLVSLPRKIRRRR